MSAISIIPAASIDISKWNNCINGSNNSLIYSQYDYLQHMADHWHGLILDDYKAVMPLTWRSKWGLKYYYQPAFTQQLGIFGNYSVEELAFIIKAIKGFCNYGDVFFNFNNQQFAQQLGGVEMTNLVIDLSIGYHQISSRYNKDLQNNLRRALKLNLIYQPGIVANAIVLYQQWYGNRFTHVTEKDYHQFKLLCQKIEQHQQVFARDIIDDSGNLLAIGLFLKDDKRIYNIMNSTTDEGRKKEANTYLIDHVIQEFAGEDVLFDFEGSDLPGVKQFYQKFGAIAQPYFHWHYNNLPPIIKWIKK